MAALAALLLLGSPGRSASPAGRDGSPVGVGPLAGTQFPGGGGPGGLSWSPPPVRTAGAHLADPARHPGNPLPGARPGMVVEVSGTFLRVPGPGEAVWGEALLAGGGHRTVGLETRPDGTVVVHRSPEGTPLRAVRGAAAARGAGGTGGTGTLPGPSAVAASAPPACGDGAYTLYSHRWTRTYEWFFQRGSTPGNMSRRRVTGALRRAAVNITGARNSCGLADRVSATTSYRGRTTRAPDIGSGSGCLARDGRSVVGFGDLRSSDLAYTCWWTQGGRAVEADVKLNRQEYRWTVKIGSGCSGSYSVEAVATHEFGHVWGLGHVSESSHGNLTMSPVIRPCQRSERTLGLGDVRGLEAKY